MREGRDVLLILLVGCCAVLKQFSCIPDFFQEHRDHPAYPNDMGNEVEETSTTTSQTDARGVFMEGICSQVRD